MTNDWLLIFDCDGVLVDSEILAIRAEERVLAEVGMAMTADEIADTCVGLSYPSMMALLEERFGRPVPDGLEERIQIEAKANFESDLTEVAGIGQLLEDSSMHRCVASSGTPERISLSLNTTGLIDQFEDDAIFSAVLVENGKPAPDLFLYAANVMGFEPARCIVVEDSPYGVEAARSAGMTPVGFTAASHIRPATVEKLTTAGAAHIASTAAELAATIARVTSG